MISMLAADSPPIVLHQGFARVVLIYTAFMALWGLFLFVRGSNPSPGYLGALVIAEGVTILQGVFGLIVFFTGHRPHDNLHWLYGFVLVMTLPTAYFFSNNASERRDSLIFGLASLFLLGIAIRGAMTGAG